ncbi:MAG: hypothetical protein HC927_14180, partial [Deltaproteobacteria bacterium]|nr:hypothetical protein [Deltaproteobacteria bacterium]
ERPLPFALGHVAGQHEALGVEGQAGRPSQAGVRLGADHHKEVANRLDARSALGVAPDLLLELAGVAEQIDLRASDREPAFVAIGDELSLALVDNNPLAMSEAHPHKQGNAIDLGGHPASEWTEVLTDALALIERYMPDLRREIDLYLRLVVPVGFDERTHLSASYQEVIGTVYMTLHPQRMTMVEALIHEFQHNKLHALLELDPLLDNAFAPLYASPVRPDPRPLQGVLLAVHAFQPVARLYQLMREDGYPGCEQPDFERRFQQIVKGNHEGATVLLEHGQPTTIGRGLLDELRRWDSHAWS